MPYGFHESVWQQRYRTFICTKEGKSLGEIFKDDSTLMWFLSKMLGKVQANWKPDHSLTSMLTRWMWVIFHYFSYLDETCAFLLRLKLWFNERKARTERRWVSFGQWRKATIILYTGRYLRCCCGGLPWKRPTLEGFFGKHLFPGGPHVTSGAIQAAELCMSNGVQGLVGGVWCFPAQLQAGVFAVVAGCFFPLVSLLQGWV